MYLCKKIPRRMTKEEILVQELRQKVERFLGMAISSKRDFETLSIEIYKHRKVLLSATTLRRLWGYQEQGAHSASITTLDVLSRLVGYPNWKAFCSDEDNGRDVSDMLSAGKSVKAEQLEVGTQVTVCWNPGRMVILEYLGSEVFRVSENTNSKLQVGDTMHCKQLTEGMPLYCEELLRPGCEIMNYVAGKEGGITFHIHQDD